MYAVWRSLGRKDVCALGWYSDIASDFIPVDLFGEGKCSWRNRREGYCVIGSRETGEESGI